MTEVLHLSVATSTETRKVPQHPTRDTINISKKQNAALGLGMYFGYGCGAVLTVVALFAPVFTSMFTLPLVLAVLAGTLLGIGVACTIINYLEELNADKDQGGAATSQSHGRGSFTCLSSSQDQESHHSGTTLVKQKGRELVKTEGLLGRLFKSNIMGYSLFSIA
jgi:hypothetical protein